MQRQTASIQPQGVARMRRYKPDALMYVTAAFLWTSVWRLQDLWPILGKLQIPLALEATLAVMLVSSLRGPRNPKRLRSRIFAIPFALLALMIIGVPFSLWIGKSVTFIVKDFVPSLLLMAGVAASVREATDLNWMALAHLIGATIYSIGTYLFVAVGSDGRLGGASYYDANDFALLLVTVIPFAIYFLRPAVVGWKRLFALCSLAVFVGMLIKTGSRGGFIAFVVVMLYVVIAFRSIPVRHRLSAVVAATLIMTIFGSSKYWDMMKTITHPDDDYNMTQQTGRKFIWKRGIGYMLAHPVLGVGAANFEQAEGMISALSQQYSAQNRGLKWSAAHNSFVLVGAELGVGGLVLFVTMIGTSFYHLAAVKQDRDDDPLITAEDAAFAQTLIASLVGFCIAGFFASAAYFSLLYALIGLVVAEDSLRRRRQSRERPLLEKATHRPRAIRTPNHVPRTHWVPAG